MAPGHVPGLGSLLLSRILCSPLTCIASPLQVSTCLSLIGYMTGVAFCLSIMELLTMAKKNKRKKEKENSPLSPALQRHSLA